MVEFVDVFEACGNGAEALRGVNLKMEKGEFASTVGSFGTGKSTFLKPITCEETPSSSETIVNGRKLSTMKKRDISYVCRMMGMAFQGFRLIDKMTVSDSMAFAMHVVGASRRETEKRVPYILNPVGLKEKINCRPKGLSGGEQQRVGLVRALMNDPSTITTDELTGNIDPALSLETVGLLSEINRRSTTVLMVVHKHRLAEHFRRRVVEIHDGLVIADSCNLALEVSDED